MLNVGKPGRSFNRVTGWTLENRFASLHINKGALSFRFFQMAIRRFNLLVMVALLPASVLFGQDDKGMTTEQLLAKNIEAKGGTAALQALKTLKLSGKLLVNDGQIELGYRQTKKQPGEVRTDATLQGMTLVQAVPTEKKGGRFHRFKDAKIRKKLSADDCKSLIEDAEIAGPLVNWKENGSTVTYLGREDVDGDGCV